MASAVGRKYDLSKIERVHLGGDGERWCRDAGRYLPKAEVAFHLDPWHVNHAVLACFADPKLAWNILEVINDGGKEEAVALLEACLDEGLAREKQARSVISYLKGNIDHIALDGPSLGTMESENQHLYGVRMDSFPCAWSVRGRRTWRESSAGGNPARKSPDARAKARRASAAAAGARARSFRSTRSRAAVARW